CRRRRVLSAIPKSKPKLVVVGGELFELVPVAKLNPPPPRAPAPLPVKPPAKRWLFGLVREIDLAEAPPRWFGRAYHRSEALVMVVALMPLNVLLAWSRNWWHWLRRGPAQHEYREIDEACDAYATPNAAMCSDIQGKCCNTRKMLHA